MTVDKTQSKECQLIVNADDFGESPEVNRGIVEAHRNGIVTSASLLTNMSGFEHALACIRDNPALDIGVHLNMHRGVPLTQCSYLANNKKFFHNPFLFVFRSYTNKKRAREEIMIEFDAQIQKALHAGVRISHLDTEKHLHTLPFIFGIVLKLAEKHNILAVRLPYESFTFSTLQNPTQLYKALVMMLCAPFNRRLVRKSTRKCPHYFYGVSLSRQFSTARLLKLFGNLHPGVTELSCHPGYSEKSVENYIDEHRQRELTTLTDPKLKEHIKNKNIVLSSFSDIR